MKRILFVDDESEVLASLERLLHPLRREWEVVLARDGAEALARLEQLPFDVLVTDVRMPGMDGVRLLQCVRERFPNVIRIALSGCFEREATLQAAATTHEYLVKPCDLARLRAAIEDCMAGAPVLPGELIRRVLGAVGPLSAPGPACRARADSREGQSALTAALVSSFEPRQPIAGFSLDEWRRHTWAAVRIAARLPVSPESAADGFAAVLLHETGQLVLAARKPHLFERALAASSEQRRTLAELEQELIGTTHAEVGAYLLTLWGQPPAVVNAVLWHAEPGRAGSSGASLDALAVTHISHGLASGGRGLDLHYLADLGVAGRVPDWMAMAQSDAGLEEIR